MVCSMIGKCLFYSACCLPPHLSHVCAPCEILPKIVSYDATTLLCSVSLRLFLLPSPELLFVSPHLQQTAIGFPHLQQINIMQEGS